MPYSVYVIYSASLDKFYVGYTENMNLRLEQHNSGISTFTSKATDWVLRHDEKFETRELAMKREKEIKAKKSRKYLEWLINKG